MVAENCYLLLIVFWYILNSENDNDTYIKILEWINQCEQFLVNYQLSHGWNEYKCISMMWCSIVSTKYLNSTVIGMCIEILPKLSIESLNGIYLRMSRNPFLTIDMVLA